MNVIGEQLKNPFTVQTPEDVSAQVVHQLWVDVFTDFKKIRDKGHSMLNGPRGCGKSMMFRYLQPDCQCLYRACEIHELDFFAILVSIKNTALNITDFQRLDNASSSVVLNEHFLTMFVASRAFFELAKSFVKTTKEEAQEVERFCSRLLIPRLVRAGLKKAPNFPGGSVSEQFSAISDLFDSLFLQVVSYLRSISLPTMGTPQYDGPLCGYIDFLYPVLDQLRSLSFMPKGPIYLLLDDADNLSEVQTEVLNSWISTRTSNSVSIKISTQMKYKTYRTPSRLLIDAPHDYSEVNIEDIYTSSKGTYLKRVDAIVRKRLDAANIKLSPKEFFPEDKEQEQEIKEIAKGLRENFSTAGRGYSAADDVIRYARPTFIAKLGGPRKSKNTYSYAGFEQLVDISSGLIRFFLEPAAQMYAEEAAVPDRLRVESIAPGTQDRIVRKEATKLMFTEFDRLFAEEHKKPQEVSLEPERMGAKHKLHNLITVLGGIFHLKLISADAERKVFSVAISGRPDVEVLATFRLGVELGYFQRTTIGNKDGTGRTPLYILTRRLAPYFTLDPTGFAGYLFVTSDILSSAIQDPEKFLRQAKKSFNRRSGMAELPLFEFGGMI